MPQGRWTISSVGGGNTGRDLVGCHIVGTSTGYELTAPNNSFLSSTTDQTVPFSFVDFPYDTWTWTLTVESLSNPVSGSWENNAPNPAEEEGTWSAGATEDTDAERGAASA